MRGVARTATGFKKVEQVVREKIAGASKRLAREILRIDRTAPNVTRKVHHVEEQDEHGGWKTVHDEQKEYPAKRRRT